MNMRAWWSWGRWLTVLALLHVPHAGAEPVWISGGDAQGQGFVFVLDKRCFAYTAGHVVNKARGAVTLVDADGYRAEARVVKIDARLDLGLLELAGGPTAHRALCRSAAATPMLQVEKALPALRRDRAEFWLDRIDSRSGGVDRMEMALTANDAGADVIELQPFPGRHAGRDREIKDGYSGAGVWAGPAGSERHRYTRDGQAAARVRGKLLGVIVSSQGDRARVVRAERVHEFIFDALEPLRRVAVEPSSVTLVERRRGPFVPAPDLPLSEVALGRLSFELDLGKFHTPVQGVKIEWDPATRAKVNTPRIGVHSSQERPADTQRWTAEACKPVERARPGAASLTCVLRDPRVVRGLRIEVHGDASAMRAISVVSEK